MPVEGTKRISVQRPFKRTRNRGKYNLKHVFKITRLTWHRIGSEDNLLRARIFRFQEGRFMYLQSARRFLPRGLYK
jgi:hypothetical protein